MRRLPSHGLRFGLPPKLHGHEIVQLQLSATVAVTCQFGAAARGGTVSAAQISTAARIVVRMPHRLACLGYRVNAHSLPAFRHNPASPASNTTNGGRV